MATNVLAIGLFAVAFAFIPTGLWFLKLKSFNGSGRIQSDRAFALASGGLGAYAFLAGFYILALEPYRVPYNEFFGLIHVFYGMVLVLGAVSVSRDLDLRPVSYLAFVGGIINILYVYINETLIHNFSYTPIFLTAALVGLSVPIATHSKSVWASRATGVLCLALAAIALYLGGNATIGHIARGLAAAK